MCYNYSLIIFDNIKEFEEVFDAKFKDETIENRIKNYYYTNAFNIPKLPVITNEEPQYFQMFYWGLIPYWVKKIEDAEKIRIKTMNARSETLFDKPSFKYSIKNKRCIIPVSGFFEWRYIFGKNYPYYIYLKNRKYFSFAGLWDSWNNSINNEIVYTYSIITCEPNNLMKKIHNKKKRMPVILPKKIERDWLNNTLSINEIKNFLIPYPDEEMTAHTISRLITSKTDNRNVPKVIESFNYPEIIN
jgi:putative SOS response-associated peptidase YedK